MPNAQSMQHQAHWPEMSTGVEQANAARPPIYCMPLGPLQKLECNKVQVINTLIVLYTRPGFCSILIPISTLSQAVYSDSTLFL